MIIPAIDLLAGRVVRLLKGDYREVTYYDQSPVGLVRLYAESGARIIHIVDLQGARDTDKRQLDLLRELVHCTPLQIQTGGGIRSEDDISELLDGGVARVIIGSLAINEPDKVQGWIKKFGREKIVLALDVTIDEHGNKWLPTHGWRQGSGKRLEEILDQYVSTGVKHILCTDISRDGTLKGSNIGLYSELVRGYSQLEWQASGGIGELKDIRSVAKTGVSGVIVGKALLDGKFTFKEAQTCWLAE
jgi:phosphoribosylformimino-5-aminoimidazole carboxamide ribotide isomerase